MGLLVQKMRFSADPIAEEELHIQEPKNFNSVIFSKSSMPDTFNKQGNSSALNQDLNLINQEIPACASSIDQRKQTIPIDLELLEMPRESTIERKQSYFSR